MPKYMPAPRRRLLPWHGAPAAPPPAAVPRRPERILEFLQAGSARASAWAAVGALYGGAGAAALGALLALGFAVRRGLIPDAGTTVAVALLGVILFMLAGGFLGAFVGGAGGAAAGWLAVIRRPDADAYQSTRSPSHHGKEV